MNNGHQETLDQLINALLDDSHVNPARFLYQFSDLEPAELNIIAARWSDLPANRRVSLLEDLAEIGEQDNLLSFDTVGCFATKDEDPDVRRAAIKTLSISEDYSLIPIFIELVNQDDNGEVRAAAARALGRFVYEGEIERLDSASYKNVNECLFETITKGASPEISRAALESLGYSSQENVSELIEKAFNSRDQEWIASSLLAMGRSANEKWHPYVLEMLISKTPMIRFHAAQAAGELEILEASDLLIELLDDTDDDTRHASIWSLSQIGGEGIHEILEQLLEETDEENEVELLESAIDNLIFNEDLRLFPLFDFPDGDEDEPEDDNEDFTEYGEFDE